MLREEIDFDTITEQEILSLCNFIKLNGFSSQEAWEIITIGIALSLWAAHSPRSQQTH